MNLHRQMAARDGLVAGASSGIGKQTAPLLVREGFRVFATGRQNLSSMSLWSVK